MRNINNMQRLSISLLDLEFNYYHTHLDVTVLYPEGKNFPQSNLFMKDHWKRLDITWRDQYLYQTQNL